MTGYVVRVLDSELDELMTGTPAVSIEGPKGVGKTATASRRAASIIRLDDPAERQAFAADPRRLSKLAAPVLLDEWQREPSSWDVVRRAVDDDRLPGRFLLTGSAAPLQIPLHSGAGRIVTARMRPMTLFERGVGEANVSLGQMLSGDRATIDADTTIGFGRLRPRAGGLWISRVA